MSAHNAFDDSEPDDADDDDEVNDPSLQFAQLSIKEGYHRIDAKNLRKYFKTGRVFITEWVERTAGASTSATSQLRHSQKDKWFIIIKSMKAHCLCVPVHTYGRLGTTKSGVSANDHVPLVAEGENMIPVYGEQPLRPAIHVIVENSSIRVSTSARIDFSRLYTVEYNYLVATVGRIHPRDVERLKQYAAQLLFGDTAYQVFDKNRENHVTYSPPVEGSTEADTMNDQMLRLSKGVLRDSTPKSPVEGSTKADRMYYAKLNPDYKVRRPGAKFFVRGKVFKALWAEMLGANTQSVTIVPDSMFGESIATKIRWFVVLREGNGHCTCLPIVTYNRQGVARRGVVKSNHCIAFSSKNEPPCDPQEYPRPGEYPMLPGIRIIPKRAQDKLDRMSRIDLSRMYTVEHSTKVYDFGNVDKEHISRLVSQWSQIISQSMAPGLFPTTSALSTKDDDDDDDDDNEDDSSDDAEANDNDDEEDKEYEEYEEDQDEESLQQYRNYVGTYPSPAVAGGYGNTYQGGGFQGGAYGGAYTGGANQPIYTTAPDSGYASGYTATTSGYSAASNPSTGYPNVPYRYPSTGGYAGTYPSSGYSNPTAGYASGGYQIDPYPVQTSSVAPVGNERAGRSKGKQKDKRSRR